MNIVINLEKPKNITSHNAVQQVKKILKAKKAGHTGTLDPMATGILLICINKATRLSQYFSDLDKEYDAILKLGETTDTQDADGKIIERHDHIDIDYDCIREAIHSFEGNMMQKPPMYSAIKHNGTPLYRLARKGIHIDTRPRPVNIRHIEILNIDLPYVHFKTICSKGTYLRALCSDIGTKLGVGAHLFALERTAVGQFNSSDAVTIQELKSGIHDITSMRGVYTIDEALSWIPALRIDNMEAMNVRNGAPIYAHQIPAFPDSLKREKRVKIKSQDGTLLGIARYSFESNAFHMKIVFDTSKHASEH